MCILIVFLGVVCVLGFESIVVGCFEFWLCLELFGGGGGVCGLEEFGFVFLNFDFIRFG